MTKSENMKTAETSRKWKAMHLAKECAEDAIDAGGSSPTDRDGVSLLPTHPLKGDWDHFHKEMEMDGSLPTGEYNRRFEDTYSEVITIALNSVETNGSRK